MVAPLSISYMYIHLSFLFFVSLHLFSFSIPPKILLLQLALTMEDHEDEYCNTGLGLKLGMTHYVPKGPKRRNNDKSRVCLDLSFTLCPKEQEGKGKDEDEEEEEEKSISIRGSSFKSVHHQDDEEHANDKGNDFISINKNSSRKKLKLTKEQSTLLEDSFKLHTTLNPVCVIIIYILFYFHSIFLYINYFINTLIIKINS